jgi:hypothetical protein
MNDYVTAEAKLDHAIGNIDRSSEINRAANDPFVKEFLRRLSIRDKDVNESMFVGFKVAQDPPD